MSSSINLAEYYLPRFIPVYVNSSRALGVGLSRHYPLTSPQPADGMHRASDLDYTK